MNVLQLRYIEVFNCHEFSLASLMMQLEMCLAPHHACLPNPLWIVKLIPFELCLLRVRGYGPELLFIGIMYLSLGASFRAKNCL